MSSREWRCSWSSADRQCSNYIWVINNFIAYLGVPYIRGFRVVKIGLAQLNFPIDKLNYSNQEKFSWWANEKYCFNHYPIPIRKQTGYSTACHGGYWPQIARETYKYMQAQMKILLLGSRTKNNLLCMIKLIKIWLQLFNANSNYGHFYMN